MLDARLVSEIEILHLIYVKYNDQQRSQRWWRYVAILHRRLYSMARHRRLDVKSAHFIQKRLAPGAARAFHAVLAQGSFITLGFALIALLARVYTLLSDLAPLPGYRHLLRAELATEAAEPLDDLGEPVDEEVALPSAEPERPYARPLSEKPLLPNPRSDLKARTQRPEKPERLEKPEKPERSRESSRASEASSASKVKKDQKKKKSKKRDAIDDIFG